VRSGIAAALAVTLTACGGGQRGTRAAGDDRVEVTIYRDAGFVRVRRHAALRAGENRIEIGGIAHTVVEGSARLRVVGGDPARVVAASHRFADGGGDQLLRGWIGRDIEVAAAGGGRITGRLLAVFSDHLVVGGGGGGVHLVPRPAQVRGPAGSREAGAPRLSWTLAAERPGGRELEAVYAARKLEWRAAYSLVLEADNRERAWLHGWLSIANRTGADLRAGRAILADRPFVRPKPPAPPQAVVPINPLLPSPPAPAPATPPTPPPAAAPEPPPGRRIALAGPLDIPSGARLELPLLAGGARSVGAATTAVFDPVGDRLDQARRRPVASRTYGAIGEGEQPLDTYVEVDLAAAGLSAAELPPGDVVVLERSRTGELAPLGRARAFHHASQSGTLRLAIGTVPDLIGRRRVTEFTRDDAGRRLVEELRVEIENRRAVAADVLVREHLYRGLNWAIAYFNQAGALSKEGPQEIHVRLRVPARSKRAIIYRVVYTW
jgi:hypothetical protein